MTIVEDLKEPLITGELSPLTIPSSVFPVAENFIAVTELSNGQANNPVSHDPEEIDSSRWVWGEIREQCWLAGPIVAMYLLQYVMNLAGTVFVGHLGSLPLAAYALASAFTNITGFHVLIGMASSLETLCGQAFGAKQYHLLGIYLQRAILILAVAAVPIGVIWLNMWRILVAMGQDPVVVEAAQSYTFWLLPVMFVYVVYFPLVKFFQTQGAVVQLMAISLVTVLFHVPLSWLLIDKLNVGLNGAAMVYTVSGVVNVSLMFGVVRFTPRFEKTFRSLSWDAFHGFGEFFGLAVPSATMFCLEHWANEVLTLLAGLLPNSKLNISSFAICMGLLSLSNMVAIALGIAASVRVSNELGAGKAHAARSAVAVAVLLALVDGTVMACSIYSLRDRWGWAFTNDFEVVQHVAQTAPYLAALSFLYALGAILSGVVRGIGWQRVGAITNLGAYYTVGLPVALISVFVIKLDAGGLWMGMGCGILTQIVALISVILCLNWDHLAQEAMLRSHSYNSRLPTMATPLLKPLQEDMHSPEDLQKLATEA